MNIRAIVEGGATVAVASKLPSGNGDAAHAVYGEQEIYIEGEFAAAPLYERAALRAGDRVLGPAIVTEMDSTTLVLPQHVGEIDAIGNILIQPLR